MIGEVYLVDPILNNKKVASAKMTLFKATLLSTSKINSFMVSASPAGITFV